MGERFVSRIYGLLTDMLCVLCVIVVILFNLAPITYIVFCITILLSLLLQYVRFKKQSISESSHSSHTRLACVLFIGITLSMSWLVADWIKYDLNTSVEQFEDFEYSTTDWRRGWPNNWELPEGLTSPDRLPEGIDKISMIRTDVAWATAYPYRYVVLEGDPKVIAQYEEIAKQNTAYTA